MATTAIAPAPINPNPIAVAVHDFGTMLEGKSTFSEFIADEGATFEADIEKLPEALQGGANLLFASLKAGASVVVGAGQAALGPILAESTDTQATQVVNLLQIAGVPTEGLLKPAEQAAVVTLINGLKAGLDRIGLQVLTQGVTAPAKS